MTQEQLRSLFQAHLDDLKSIMPGVEDCFICPICLGEFSQESMTRGEVTVGHVWPKEIRDRAGSPIAADQRVLLCKQCNSMAGTRGDKQMQLREKLKEGWEKGQMYGERLVQVLPAGGPKPINLRATVHGMPGAPQVDLVFPVDAKKARWERTSPDDQQRFAKACQEGGRFGVIVHPYHESLPGLARVGWVTSAYLQAFFTFGYRYILHECLDPVRQLILSSFEEHRSRKLEPPGLDTVSLQECSECHSTEPEVELVVPVDRVSPVRLRISFLDYHVWLPFLFVPQLLEALLWTPTGVLEEAPEEGANLLCRITCTKRDGHDCMWDYVLGKPLPEALAGVLGEPTHTSGL